jgi:hypothetical protein
MSGISKSQVSRLCEEIDQQMKAFLKRPIEERLALPVPKSAEAYCTYGPQWHGDERRSR